MEEFIDKEYELKVREYIAKMLSNRKGRRALAKKDGKIKDWDSIQNYYGPINKPLDLGINAFKKLARQRLDKPYKYVKNYKEAMYNALKEIIDGSTDNSTTSAESGESNTASK